MLPRACTRLMAMVSVISILLGCSACAARLRPAPSAQTAASDPNSATASAEGVTVTVTAGAWDQDPRNLARVLTALHVHIQNNSAHLLRIRYNEFTLADGSGFQYQALPPHRIEGSVVRPARSPLIPRFDHYGFYAAPWYGGFFNGIRPWSAPWGFDGMYYDRYYSYWRLPLPTQDMLEYAIPEGVLEREGRVGGFLYFPKLEAATAAVDFQVNLINARNGLDFARVRIPFVFE